MDCLVLSQFLKRRIPRRKFFFTHMNICLMVIRKSSTHSVIEGSVGQSFDIVVALKQKMSPLASSESRDNTGAEITKHKICLISWGKIMRSYRQKLKLMRKHMDHGVEPVVSCLTMGFIPALPNFVFVNRIINHFNLL